MDISHEVFVFLEACMIGAVFGVAYDAFRIFRLSFKNPKILVFFEDVVYFLFVAMVSFIFIIVENNGVLRGFLIFGELIGMILYFFTVSILLMKSANIIIKFIKAILLFIYRITLKQIIKLFCHIIKKVVRFVSAKKIKLKIITPKCKLHLK